MIKIEIFGKVQKDYQIKKNNNLYSYKNYRFLVTGRYIENLLNFEEIIQQMLDIKTLETWLWNAACSIRGAVDAPKFKDYILPMVFVKRLSDVFEDESKQTKEILEK